MARRKPDKSAREAAIERRRASAEERRAPDAKRRRSFAWGGGVLLAAAVAALVIPRVARELRRPPGPDAATPTASSTSPTGQASAPRSHDDPSDLAARSEVARVALGRGDWTAAWQQTQAILRESPGNPLALTYQSLVRFTMGQPEAAILMLERSQAQAPDLLDTYAILSLIYAKTGRLDLAQQVMDNAAERFPTRRQLLGQMFAELRAQVVHEVATAASPPSQGAMIPAHGSEPDLPAAGELDRGELRVSGVVALADPAARRDGAVRVLFVIAHDAANAQSAPLALQRLEARSFPVRFALHDGDSVLGQPLPGRFRVEARLDEDGDPETRSASDLAADSGPLSSGASGIELKLANGPP